MITPKALHPTCARVLTREEARDALGRVLRVCRESGFDTGKRTKFFDILMRVCHRKGSRSSNR